MNQLLLFEAHTAPNLVVTRPAAPFVKGSETSRAAATAIGGKAGTLREQVLDFIRRRREFGTTDEEISLSLNLPDNTSRPRRRELCAAGLVTDSGRTRPTRSGRLAVVWILAEL